jgi:hypothetical protein
MIYNRLENYPKQIIPLKIAFAVLMYRNPSVIALHHFEQCHVNCATNSKFCVIAQCRQPNTFMQEKIYHSQHKSE